MRAEQIVKRASALESQRKTLENTYQIIEKYVRPFSGEFFRPMNSEHEVDWRRREIYDSTAIVAADLLAGQIHANLVSPAVKWFDFAFRDTAFDKDIEAQKWLDELEEITWQTLADSDFNLQVAEFLLDLVTYGGGVMFEEEEDESEWKGIDFTAIPVRDCYFEPNAKGQPLRLYRRLQYTTLQLLDRFEMPPEWIAAHKEHDDVDKKWTIWFCIFPRDDELKAYEAADIKPKRIAPNVRPYGYKYVMQDSLIELEEGGYYDMPAFHTMWKKVAGSRNGHSPAFIALSDILQLNEVVKQSSEARAKAIDPPTITTERGIIGDVDLEPGGLTMVTEMDQIETLESKARFDVQDGEVFRLQTSIRAVFFIDKLELKDSPAMTATEVNVRYERMMRQFASTLGRLQSDFLDKLLHRTIDIILRHGAIRPAPENVPDASFDIVYTGPIPRAQQAEIANSIEQFMADITALGEVFPELLDLPDPDKMGHELARVRGVPTRILRNTDEIKQIRAERKEQEEQAMELAMAEQAGKSMKAVGEGNAALEQAG
jgi:hypothetical protein